MVASGAEAWNNKQSDSVSHPESYPHNPPHLPMQEQGQVSGAAHERMAASQCQDKMLLPVVFKMWQ